MSALADFKEKAQEIDLYFKFIFLIEKLDKIENSNHLKKEFILSNTKKEYPLRSTFKKDEKNYKITTDIKKILKANCFLLMYNLIEGTINSVLNEYFRVIDGKSIKYKDLKGSIKQSWLKYNHKSLKKNPIDFEEIVNIIDSVFEEKFKIADKRLKSGETLSNYDAYVSEIGSSEVSGNLDSRKITELSMKYGFDIPATLTCNHLLTIKNNRNKLSHGEETFGNIGRVSIEDLVRMKKEVVEYLSLVISHVEECKRTQSFKII